MDVKDFLQNGEQTKVQDIILEVEDYILRTILTERYINGLKWEQIAETLDYTPRHIQRLHNKALEAVQGIFNEQ